ncbi:MAG: adenine phosphoribosyltransferase [Acidimicrobiales bacterium]|nr:adenine phosphoribosyltransferase [Acidimicrobiales bacterium]
MSLSEIDLKQFIQNVPDFPREGINFKDVSPLLKDAAAFATAVSLMARAVDAEEIDYVAGIEARGFIFGSALANALNLGFIAIRKAGKLPGEIIAQSYNLEYGESSLEMQRDAVPKGSNVLIVDDVLATGGTAKSAAKLVERIGGRVVGFVFLASLEFLNGREEIANYHQHTLLTYD